MKEGEGRRNEGRRRNEVQSKLTDLPPKTAPRVVLICVFPRNRASPGRTGDGWTELCAGQNLAQVDSDAKQSRSHIRRQRARTRRQEQRGELISTISRNFRSFSRFPPFFRSFSATLTNFPHFFPQYFPFQHSF